MIEAHFSKTQTQAAISGAYQYDTGQRLWLTGLPSPSEIERSGKMVEVGSATVQVHFSWTFEESAAISLAQWNSRYAAWVCSVPDEYFTRHAEVNVHVTIYYGEKKYEEASAISEGEETGEIVMTRMETEYEAVFIPRSRPAPYGIVTPEQAAAWESKKAEITLAKTDSTDAADAASTQAASTLAKAQEADEAAKDAQEAAQEAGAADRLAAGYAATPVRAEYIAAGETAAAVLSEGTIVLYIPRGENGAQGEAGEDGPSDIEITFSGGALSIAPR